MKKKSLLISLFIIFFTFTLSACSSRPSLEEAGEILIEGYVFNKDQDKLKEYFNIEIKKDPKQDSLKTSERVVKKYLTKLEKETTYKVKVKDDNRKQPVITIEVKSIDMDKFMNDFTASYQAGMLAYIHEHNFPNVKEAEDLKHIDPDRSDEIKALMKEYSEGKQKESHLSEAMETAIQKMQPGKKVNRFDVQLIPHKNGWRILNQKQFAKDVFEAFKLNL